MTPNIQIQKPNSSLKLPRPMFIASGTFNTRYPGQSENTRRPKNSPRSYFDDNLTGFSLVPTWLQLVSDQLHQTSEKSYPFQQNSSPSPALSTCTSKPHSPLNTPLCFDTLQLLNSPSGRTSSSEEDDRLYWEEEITWSDENEQIEDFEDVYKSFRY